MKEKIDASVNPRAHDIIMQAVGRLQGCLLYTREEAIAEAQKVLAMPLPRGGKKSMYGPKKTQPYRPGVDAPPKLKGA